jgi:sugar/nucleoside kinase (ribokinase family)
MPRILVSGLINIETTLRVDGFPIHYTPVRYPFYGINATVSGVGYNIAKALTTLGDEVDFLSIIGKDGAEKQIRSELKRDNIPDDFVLCRVEETAQSVILYDESGRRQINVDLKDIQEQIYPLDVLHQAADQCDLFSLCNINFSRPMLDSIQQNRKQIATDVHTISSIDDDYNMDFMRAANILFMSDEALADTPENFARKVTQAYGTEILVIGLGCEGALLYVRSDNFLERIPAVQTRQVVNTIGAGDALFSAFIHSYAQSSDPYESIQKAVIFASYKIGTKGAADGFLKHSELEEIYSSLSI